MITLPVSIADIDKLILDGVQEDLHLDYKQSLALDPNKTSEISKDVSAFANSDGGILIYGVTEQNNLPEKIDGGVDHTKFSRERFEQIISSNITPKIDGIQIIPIPVSANNSLYAVEIPKSFRAPHQAKDKKYYKRYNFHSVAMEDYEINDVRGRQTTVLPLINIDIFVKGHFIAYFKVSNIGSLPAIDVSFSFDREVLWMYKEEKTPPLFKKGTKYFPVGQTLYFTWNNLNVLLHPPNEEFSKLEITVKYLHPQINEYISDTFKFDVEDYRNSNFIKSDSEEVRDILKEHLKKLTDEVKRLNSNLENFRTIAGKTGLDLSITTLRNLKHFVSGEDFEKLNPEFCDYRVFMELLNIDFEMAHNMEHLFRYSGETGKKLEEIKNITPDIISNFKKYFLYDE